MINIVVGASFSVQAAAVSGSVFYYLGKAFSKIDPVKLANFASITGGVSVAAGIITSFAYPLIVKVDHSKRTEEQKKDPMKPIPFVIGITLSSLGSSVYYREFPLIYTIFATFMGVIGSVGLRSIVVHNHNLRNITHIIQSTSMGWLAGLHTAKFFPGIEVSLFVYYAATTAYASVAYGSGMGIICDLIPKKYERILKTKPYLVVLSTGVGVVIQGSKNFPLVAKIAYASIGILGSIGVEYLNV